MKMGVLGCSGPANGSVGGRLSMLTVLTPPTRSFPPILFYQQVRRHPSKYTNNYGGALPHTSQSLLLPTCAKTQKKFWFLPHLRQNLKIYTGAFAHFWGPLHPSTSHFHFLGPGAKPLAAAKRRIYYSRGYCERRAKLLWKIMST